MADQQADVKKQVAEARAEREKNAKELADKMAKSKPTPTQEENDLAMMGVSVPEHEDDGSGPDPTVKQSEARPSGGGAYQTRQHTAETHKPSRAS